MTPFLKIFAVKQPHFFIQIARFSCFALSELVFCVSGLLFFERDNTEKITNLMLKLNDHDENLCTE